MNWISIFFFWFSQVKGFDYQKFPIQANDKKIYLKGIILDSSDISKVEIRVYKELFLASNNADIFKQCLIKGNRSFEFEFNAIDSIMYFDLSFYSQKSKTQTQHYVLEPGDSIHINFEKDKLSFSGLGAEKLRCVDEMNNYTWRSLPMTADNRHHVIDSIYLHNRKRRIDRLYEKKLEILGSYKQRLSPASYKLIKVDCIGDKLASMFGGLRNTYTNGRMNNRKEILSFYNKNYLAFQIDTSGVTWLSRSKSYGNAILDKLKLDVEVQAIDFLQSASDYSFGRLFININDQYGDILRDRILVLSLVRGYETKDSADFYLDRALTIVKTERYSKMLQEIKNRKAPGSPVYTFELEDSSGRVYSPRDFKNKFLIFDFWFTGCGSCLDMAKYMKSIIEIYGDRKDILFISVSVDASKRMWMKSLAGGKYTHVKNFNLYTRGFAENHPLIRFYRYQSFPKLLLVDKRGRIFSSNPPKPFNEASKKLLSTVIGNALTIDQ